MAKFSCIIPLLASVCIDVDANTEEEAKEKAYSLLTNTYYDEVRSTMIEWEVDSFKTLEESIDVCEYE